MADLPQLPAQVLESKPVTSSRLWTDALVPNVRGGWNYIVQSYALHDVRPAEWVVIKDLTTNPTQTIYQTTSGIYTFEQLSHLNQLRAANGKVFFPAFGNYIFYYDPATESVLTLSQVTENPPEPNGVSYIPYSQTFGPDQRLYMGTQESRSRSPMIFVLDPTTLAIQVLGYVGSNLLAFTTYAYYIVADTSTANKYVYVAVGKDPWQLWALNILGTQPGNVTKLFEVTNTGNIQFSLRTEGITAIIDSDLGHPDNVRTTLWCVDGTTYPYTPGYNPLTLPFTPRNVTQYTNPVSNPPLLDNSNGIGLIKWRNTVNDPYTSVNYTVNNATPIQIESILQTSNGNLLGNAVQYEGFFKTIPGVSNTWFGPWASGTSETKSIQVGTLVYFVGYPNGVLYRYVPGSAWNPGTNPVQLGFYHTTSFLKHPTGIFLSNDGQYLYVHGSLDREGQGTALGRYTISDGTFIGRLDNTNINYPLNFYNPKGFVQLGNGNLVSSGSIIADPAYPGQTPTDAALFIWDAGLNSVAQPVPKPGVTDLGQLFTCSEPNTVVGLTSSGGLYSFNTSTLGLNWIDTGQPFGAAIQDTQGIWAINGLDLVNINPDTLETNVIFSYPQSSVPQLLAWNLTHDTLWTTNGPNLYGQVAVPASEVPEPLDIDSFLRFIMLVREFPMRFEQMTQDMLNHLLPGQRAMQDKLSGLDATGSAETETVTSGSLSATCPISYLSVTGTQTYTLPNGIVPGQIKRIFCTVAASTPAGTLTITTPNATTGLVCATTWFFDTVGQGMDLVWDGAAWNALRVRRAGGTANNVVVGTTVLTGKNLWRNYFLSVTSTVASSTTKGIPDGSANGERILVSVSTASTTPSGTISLSGTLLAGTQKLAGTATLGTATATTHFASLEWDMANGWMLQGNSTLTLT